MKARVFRLQLPRLLRVALHVTLIAIAGCGGHSIGNGAVAGRGEAIDASIDSSAAEPMDAAAPTMQDAPAVEASPALLDALSAGKAQCTATDLQGQTCETLGFAGGLLGCSASCSFDTSGCSTCVEGPRTACASLDVGGSQFALATSGTEIGLAWGDGNGTLHFTRFSADLNLLSDDCIGTLGFDAPSLASTSAGWMIAAHWGKQILLYPLDHAGRARGPTQVLPVAKDDPMAPTYFRGGPTLSPLPSGDRLFLTWVEDNYYYCFSTSCPHLLLRLVTDDGSPVTGPDGGDSGVGLVGDYSSVPLGDGLALANLWSSIDLWYFTIDGSVSKRLTVSPDNNFSFGYLAPFVPKIGWSGTELRLLYRPSIQLRNDGTITLRTPLLQRISPAFAVVGNPVPIDAGPTYALDYDTLLAFGADSVVHVTQSANSRYVENLVRFDSSGTLVLPPVPVVRANYAVNLQPVAQGGDAVVAWVAPSNVRPTRIELARVRLAP